MGKDRAAGRDEGVIMKLGERGMHARRIEIARR